VMAKEHENVEVDPLHQVCPGLRSLPPGSNQGILLHSSYAMVVDIVEDL